MRVYAEMPDQIKEVSDTVHWELVDLIEALAELVQPDSRLLVIGSNSGSSARLAAWWFGASELHMVDIEVEPEPFESVCPEHFYKLDIHSEEFVETFQGKVDIILCFMVTHELFDPEVGITNVLRVLPQKNGCFAYFLDFLAEGYLEAEADLDRHGLNDFQREHFLKDLENVKRLGLTNQEKVYALYESAVAATGHVEWKKHFANGGYSGMVYHKPTTYAVVVGTLAR